VCSLSARWVRQFQPDGRSSSCGLLFKKRACAVFFNPHTTAGLFFTSPISAGPPPAHVTCIKFLYRKMPYRPWGFAALPPPRPVPVVRGGGGGGGRLCGIRPWPVTAAMRTIANVHDAACASQPQVPWVPYARATASWIGTGTLGFLRHNTRLTPLVFCQTPPACPASCIFFCFDCSSTWAWRLCLWHINQSRAARAPCACSPLVLVYKLPDCPGCHAAGDPGRHH